MNTGELRRTWALMPARARKRVVKSAAISAALNGLGTAGAPYLLATGGLHKWADLEALGWVCLYGALLGLFIHFKQPGYRLQERPRKERGEVGLKLLGAIAVLVALFVCFLAWMLRDPATVEPRPHPTPWAAPVTPAPPPVLEDNDLPPVPHLTPVCCCQTPGGVYGECVDRLMVRESAILHGYGDGRQPRHTHDLIGRRCADATEEEMALRRVLLQPHRVEAFTAATLGMADRAAYRERMR